MLTFTTPITGPHNMGSLALGLKTNAGSPILDAKHPTEYSYVNFEVVTSNGEPLTQQILRERGLQVGMIIDWIKARLSGVLRQVVPGLEEGPNRVIICRCCEDESTGQVKIWVTAAHPVMTKYLHL
jgi:hypothetical protein